MLTRRKLLKGVSAGAGGIVFAPMLKTLAANVQGNYTPPKRIVFVLFDNGFAETGIQPVGLPLGTETVKQVPMKGLKLPPDIEPFAPFQDRMTIIQGLRAYHLSPDHGGGFRSLSGLPSSDKYRSIVGESIDAAAARVNPGVFPLLVLGIAAGKESTTAALVSSAWGANKPIAAQCRPELAYESLFGSLGASRNDFAARKNLLDFVSGDVKRMKSQFAGPEREQMDYHLEAMESLTKRDDQLSKMFDAGLLIKHAPKMPAKPVELMTDTFALQCDIAAAALITGLTNVVTITSGLCKLGTSYSGITNTHTHGLGHNGFDNETKLLGHQVLAKYRRYLAEQTAKLLAKLQATPEGRGTMLDNTLLVFTSDSANRQHTGGENWPFLLVGNLGGTFKAGQYVSYPIKELRSKDEESFWGAAPRSNPAINALYCTLLHAMGKPRDTFNLPNGLKDDPALFGPLKELLV